MDLKTIKNETSARDLNSKGFDPITDLVISTRVNLSQKLKMNYFTVRTIRNPNRMTSSPIGPRQVKFVKLKEKKQEVSEFLDSCRYHIEEVDPSEKQDTIKLPFNLHTPRSKKVNFSLTKGGDTLKYDTVKLRSQQDPSERRRNQKGILTKKITGKSRQPSLSRISKRTSSLRCRQHRSQSNNGSRYDGFNDACRSAFKEIIQQHKYVIQQKKKRRNRKLMKEFDPRFGRSLQPDFSPKKLGKKKCAVSGRIGFLDDPFFGKIEFDKNGFVVSNLKDIDVRSRNSEI